MFCEKCGKENAADVKFCEGCGAPLAPQTVEEPAAPVAETPKAEEPKEKKAPKINLPKVELGKILKIAIPAVAAVLVIIIVASLFGGSTYEKTYKNYLDARADGNGAKLQKLVVDPYYLEYLTGKDGGNYKEEEVEWRYDEKAEDAKDSVYSNYGKNVRYSVKTEYLTKYNEKQIKNIAKYLEDEYDYEKKDVKNVVVLEYKVTVKGSEASNTYYGERALIKIKGKWYVSEIITDKDDIRDILN